MIGEVDAKFVARWELAGVGGVVVAVDVLRAFTTAAYAFAAGAAEIWLAAEVDEALALARQLPNALVLGEDQGRRPPGFDFANSPVAIATAQLAGRVPVQRTSAGTRGVLAAVDADEIYAASLVNASATAEAVARHGEGPPTYVVTGRFPDHPNGGDDDLLTAQLIERARLGEPLQSAETARRVAASREAGVTLALGGDDVHPDDVAFATAVDRFRFAMRVQRVDGLMRLVREDVS